MKKIASIFVILFLLVSVGIILSSLREITEMEKTIEYVQKGEAVRVLSGEDVFFEYSIEEFREWAKANWSDIFRTPPSFGEAREVDPENFYRFDDTATISPRSNFLAFSVNDYAVATSISFIGVVDLRSKEVNLVGKENMGGVQSLYWSPDENYIAYTLNTARARGDYLSVDNRGRVEKEFTLSGTDIFNILTEDGDSEEGVYLHFMPNFRGVEWTERGRRLTFTTDDHTEDYVGVKWSINPQGEDLKIEDKIKKEKEEEIEEKQ